MSSKQGKSMNSAGSNLMRERKTAWLHVRLTPTQHAALQQLAAERYGGKVSRLFISMLNEVNRGPQKVIKKEGKA